MIGLAKYPSYWGQAMTLSDLEVLIFYYRPERPPTDYPGIVVPSVQDAIVSLVRVGLLKRSDEPRPGNDYDITDKGRALIDMILTHPWSW